MQLTKEYFDKQLQRFVVKDDLTHLATKDDLKKLVTKDDLKLVKQYLDEQITGVLAFLTDKAAHKDDLAVLATDINKEFNKVHAQLVFLENDVTAVREELRTIDKRTAEDDNAFSKELLKLKHRMDQIEKQVRKYKHQT